MDSEEIRISGIRVAFESGRFKPVRFRRAYKGVLDLWIERCTCASSAPMFLRHNSRRTFTRKHTEFPVHAELPNGQNRTVDRGNVYVRTDVGGYDVAIIRDSGGNGETRNEFGRDLVRFFPVCPGPMWKRHCFGGIFMI